MEARMRALIGTILVTGMMLASSAAPAQTYDPGYPVCIEVASIDGTSITCRYDTLAQCRASASGRAAQCFGNPYYYAQAGKKAPRRANQRQ